jgi:hypothetical protein
MRRLLAGIGLLVALAGCKGQSDLEKLCNDEGNLLFFRRSGDAYDPQRGLYQARKIMGTTTDPKVLRMVSEMMQNAPENNAAVLEAAVAEQKVESCPLLDYVKKRR